MVFMQDASLELLSFGTSTDLGRAPNARQIARRAVAVFDVSENGWRRVVKFPPLDMARPVVTVRAKASSARISWEELALLPRRDLSQYGPDMVL
jgi:hypothetical protein